MHTEDDHALRSVKALDALLSATTLDELKQAYLGCVKEEIEVFGVQMKLLEGLTATTKVTVDEYFTWMWIALSEHEEVHRDAA